MRCADAEPARERALAGVRRELGRRLERADEDRVPQTLLDLVDEGLRTVDATKVPGQDDAVRGPQRRDGRDVA
jgi:hypothetical protein